MATRATYIPMGCLIYEAQVLARKERGPRLFWQAMVVGTTALIVRILLDGQLLRIDSQDLFRAAYMGSGLMTVSAVLTAGLVLQHRHQLIEHRPWLRPVTRFGRTGYSFYLLHGPVVKVGAHLLFPWLALQQAPALLYWLGMPFVFTMAAAAGFLLYHYVEVPCRGLLIDASELDGQAKSAGAQSRASQNGPAILPTAQVVNLPR